ncbi:hypothetical protein KBD81_04205 [Candidatus Woesebacteria bacterium]|nr:hypothetical protein [Candidatus Woesebacteria bacterium]
MDNKFILSSLAMDLKRVALGIHRGSHKTAERFYEEALKRKQEVNQESLVPYMQKILHNVEMLQNIPEDRRAEDALMYSTRIQNYVLNR